MFAILLAIFSGYRRTHWRLDRISDWIGDHIRDHSINNVVLAQVLFCSLADLYLIGTRDSVKFEHKFITHFITEKKIIFVHTS